MTCQDATFLPLPNFPAETRPQPNVTVNISAQEHVESVSLHSLNPESTVAMQWYICGQKFFTGVTGNCLQTTGHWLWNITRNNLGFYRCESCNSATSSISNPVLIKVIFELRALLKGGRGHHKSVAEGWSRAEIQLVPLAKLVVSALRQGACIIFINASYYLRILFKSFQARDAPSHCETCYRLPRSRWSIWALGKGLQTPWEGHETLAPPATYNSTGW